MKYISTTLMIMTFSAMYGQGIGLNMVPDTVDYESTRMYFMVPEISMKMSNVIEDDEGFWICYPVPSKFGKPGVLVIDCSVMNRNYLKYTKDYDMELWNTFNRNDVGSRCFKKNGLFYRIDRYEDGLEVFYTDVGADMVETMNETMRSLLRKPKINSDPPLNVLKRRVKD